MEQAASSVSELADINPPPQQMTQQAARSLLDSWYFRQPSHTSPSVQ